MEFSLCSNAYFHRCVLKHQWKVQTLKALAFKACGFVPYAL